MASALVVLQGCGSKDKVTVTGTVTWNGEPIERGYITFFSAPLVPGGAGPISDGHFRFQSKPGNMSVQITASRIGAPAEKSASPAGQPRESQASKSKFKEKGAPPVQYIPAKYNQQTTLTANVTLDGDNHFDFPLQEESRR